MTKERLHPARFVRKALGEVIFHIFAKGVEVEGLKNLPPPPYIGAFNHTGIFEVGVLGLYLPHYPHFMSKRENFEIMLLGPILKTLGVIPVSRGEVDRRAIRTTHDLLKKGKVVSIAPEGTRGRGKERTVLKQGKTGIIYLAIRANTPIVPIAIWGTEGIFPLIEEKEAPLSERFSIKRERIHVRIGEPFGDHLESQQRRLTSKVLKSLADNLMVKIRNLLPPEYHGYYAAYGE